MSKPFDIDAYRVERCRDLGRENEFLRAELDRVVQLLAETLRVAVGGTGVSATALLAVLADLNGMNLGIAAFVEERERRNAQAFVERVVRVLRET